MTTSNEQSEAAHVDAMRRMVPSWNWNGIWCRKIKKLRLFEVYWMRGLGPGYGAPENYHAKVSVGIEWKLPDLWVGAFWKSDPDTRETFLWICLIPCLPLRIHYQRSYGGLMFTPNAPQVARKHRRRWWQVFQAV